MSLPENVFRIQKPSGKVYFYHQAGRSGPKALRGPLTRIQHEPRDPEFWQVAKALNQGKERAVKEGSFGVLIKAYRESPKWKAYADGTRETYGIYLDVMDDAWADRLVDELSLAGILQLRTNVAKGGAAAANMLLVVMRILLKWGCSNGICAKNPARDVEPLPIDRKHAMPWTEAAWTELLEKGPADLSRYAFLGRKTGQRISDVIRMRPADIRGDVIMVKIKKRRGLLHPIVLAPEDISVIKGWGVGDLQPFVARPDGRRHSEHSLRERLAAWFEKDASEETKATPFLPHGLRAMAFCDARLKGLSNEDIAALYGVTPEMVRTYTAHIDKEAEARNARRKMTRGEN